MPLKLILGPANSAKAGEVLGGYAAAAHRGALLVVPTAADAEHYSSELAAQGSVTGSVLTFAGLAAEIARRARYGGQRLTPLQRDRVLRRILRGVRFEALEGGPPGPGFVSAAGRLLAELQRSLVTPKRLRTALSTWAADNAGRRAYARDLAAIYQAYTLELDRLGRVDHELYTWRALDALRAAPGWWGTDPVFFYGFDDLHALELDAVRTLARVVGVEVSVSLTYEAGRAALEARAETVQELRSLADRVVELRAVETYYEPRSRTVLHHLERQLFQSPPRRVDAGETVRLLEAAGERAEAELVAAEALRELQAGVPGEQIVVIYRNLERATAIERVLRQYGVPFAIDRQLPFAHTPLGRGVLALARCGLLEEDRARAVDLLAYLRCPGVLGRLELADALEVAIRREGLRTAAQARDRLALELDEIARLRHAADPAAEIARQARRLLAAPRRGRGAVLAPDEELDARALARMLQALIEIDELSEKLSGEELIELLEGLRVPAGAPVREGAVLISEPLAIRARRFRVVFVCGLGEREFPLASSPEPFLSEDRRHELAVRSGLRLRVGEDDLLRERYLFYACVSRATARVVLSYRSCDEEGNLALPSPFVADVADVLDADWQRRRSRRLLADVVWPPSAAPTERELDRALAAAQAPFAGEPPAPMRLLSEVSLGHVRHREMVSGGALETYSDCPVRWLVERELRPAEMAPEPDPIARGRYMHAVLEKVLGRLGGPVTQASLPDALVAVDELLAEPAGEIAPGAPAAVRAGIMRSIGADLRRYLVREAADGCEWQPSAFELRFGFDAEEGSLPALELGGGVDAVRVRGAIDRVDVDRAGGLAVVRDYKSGAVRPEYQGARWRADGRLQVALYMLAVRDLLGLQPVAGLYQPLGGGDLRPRGVFLRGASIGSCLVGTDAREQEELSSELEDAAARARALATRLRGGRLEPCPETCSRDGCMYPGICRSSG